MQLDELTDLVRLDIPDAPAATVKDQIRRMAREFCTEADAWVQEGEVVSGARSDQPQVTASTGQPLRVIDLFDGEKRIPSGGFYQLTPTTITFYREPDNDTLKGRVACRPALGNDPPDEVLERWAEPIGDGARWRLLMMPQPWQSGDLAAIYKRSYTAGLNEAKRLSRLGHNYARNRVRPRPFL